MRTICSIAALALLVTLSVSKPVRAENWVKPLANDAYWWVDLDSARRDANGMQIFKLHMGANPKGRPDPMMNYTQWAAVECSSASLFHYNEASKTWDNAKDGGYLGRAIVPLVCR